ncbi:hypothetical protein FXO38_15089 [Capsicum annuum]|nr:hypothetical protein FXO38_15089 [Capsicum annuum]
MAPTRRVPYSRRVTNASFPFLLERDQHTVDPSPGERPKRRKLIAEALSARWISTALQVTRRELQAVCKKNKIPANMTNVAMADALQSRQFVDGIEEVLKTCESDVANSSMESPGKKMKMLYIWPSEASYNVDNDIRLIYREGNPHSSNMVFGLGPSMKRADLSLQIRPRHAGFGSSRKYSLHSPGPTGGFLRALSFIKKLLHLMVREVLSSVHIIRKMAVALITTVIWMLRGCRHILSNSVFALETDGSLLLQMDE